MVHDGDAVTEPLGLFHVVRGQQDGAALAFEVLDVLENVVAGLRVDADGGLVEQQHLRLVQQGAGKLEPVLHAAGERFHQRAGPLDECRPLEKGCNPPAQPPAVHAVQPPEEHEVLAGGHVVVQGENLRGDADGLALPAGSGR